MISRDALNETDTMARFLLVVLLSIAATQPAAAHFTMLLPQSLVTKKGEPVTIVYQWGHPFEHQLFDAQLPEQLRVITPDGTSRLLSKSLEKISVPGEGKDATAYRLRFTPEERGDYTFIVSTPPIWMAEEQEFLQDTAKVVVHVQAQKGWDVAENGRFQIVPLTRPYGITAGMVFRARVPDGRAARGGTPMPQDGLIVFSERYNPQPPKMLPPDELITFTSKTDPSGVLALTLPTSGWWCVAAQRDAGRRQYQGKDYPLRQRVILWVYVNETAK
jgi:cobalt/nickel transport protein